jgi:hypothetical protein
MDTRMIFLSSADHQAGLVGWNYGEQGYKGISFFKIVLIAFGAPDRV